MLLVPYMRNFGVILERLPEEKRMQALNEHIKNISSLTISRTWKL